MQEQAVKVCASVLLCACFVTGARADSLPGETESVLSGKINDDSTIRKIVKPSLHEAALCDSIAKIFAEVEMTKKHPAGDVAADFRMEVVDSSDEIVRLAKDNSSQHMEDLCVKIRSLVDSYPVNRPSWKNGSGEEAFYAIEIGNLASWLDQRQESSKSVQLQEASWSLYESAYKLGLKAGIFDHFTAVHLNRFCSFLKRNKEEQLADALKNQARCYIAGDHAKDIAQFGFRMQEALCDLNSAPDSSPVDLPRNTKCLIAEHDLRLQERESFEEIDGLQRYKTELRVAECYFDESKNLNRARSLMESAVSYLERTNFLRQLDPHEQPADTLGSCIYCLAQDLHESDVPLLLRALIVYETKVEYGVDSDIVRMNRIQDPLKNRLLLLALAKFLKFQRELAGKKIWKARYTFEGIVAVYERVGDYAGALRIENDWLDLVSQNYGASSDEVAREHLKLAQIYALSRQIEHARDHEALAMEELRNNHHTDLMFGGLGAAEVELNDLAQKYALLNEEDCDRAVREDFEIDNQAKLSAVSGEFQSRLLEYLLGKYRDEHSADKELSLLRYVLQLKHVQRDRSANSLRFRLAALYLDDSMKSHYGDWLDEKRDSLRLASSEMFRSALELSVSDKGNKLEQSHAIECCESRIDQLRNYGLDKDAADLEIQLRSKFTANEIAGAARPKPSKPEEVVFTETERKEFLKIYQNPLVKHLRETFDQYLQGNAKIAEGKILSQFDKSYLESPFIVLTYSKDIMGGAMISLIFQNKPDKIFQAWVYNNGDFSELRMFDFGTEDDIALAQIKKRYAEIMNDRTMAF